MRMRTFWLFMLLCFSTAAPAQVNIGINISLFPELVRVPDYPVYYAPRLGTNYFFYDGMYWIFQGDDWYSSEWYNGPWYRVAPEFVPVYVLRIPVRYYRHPPAYFHGWRRDAPPHWGEHWGRDWELRRSGWDRWNRRAVPAPAPLPVYQRQYSGSRYPRVEEQRVIREQKYRYQPRDNYVREHVEPQVRQAAPAPRPVERTSEPRRERSNEMHEREQRAPSARAPQPAPQRQPPPRPQAGPAAAQEGQPPGHREERQAREREHTPPARHEQGRPQQQAGPAQRAAPQQHGNAGGKGEQGRERGNEKGNEKGRGKGE